jgi:hypothetical protein
MKCIKCQSEDLNYDGSGLTCEKCCYKLENVSEIKALEIAFRKKSKKNNTTSYKKEIEKIQAQQTKKEYFRFRYFEVE